MIAGWGAGRHRDLQMHAPCKNNFDNCFNHIPVSRGVCTEKKTLKTSKIAIGNMEYLQQSAETYLLLRGYILVVLECI